LTTGTKNSNQVLEPDQPISLISFASITNPTAVSKNQPSLDKKFNIVVYDLTPESIKDFHTSIKPIFVPTPF